MGLVLVACCCCRGCEVDEVDCYLYYYCCFCGCFGSDWVFLAVPLLGSGFVVEDCCCRGCEADVPTNFDLDFADAAVALDFGFVRGQRCCCRGCEADAPTDFDFGLVFLAALVLGFAGEGCCYFAPVAGRGCCRGDCCFCCFFSFG